MWNLGLNRLVEPETVARVVAVDLWPGILRREKRRYSTVLPLFEMMSTTVTSTEVRANPRRYRRKYLVISVGGSWSFPNQLPHSANGVLERIVVYFDAHSIFRNFSMLPVLTIFSLNLFALAPTLSQLMPSEFEEVTTFNAIQHLHRKNLQTSPRLPAKLLAR